MMRKVLRTSAVTLVVTLISAVLWLLLDGLFGHRIILEVYHFDVSSIDHRLQPNSRALPTNGDGIKGVRESSEFREEDFNIIFLGDSFVYNSLPGGISIPELLEKRLNERLQTQHIKVVNFAWPSSSPFLSLRLLRDLGEKYRPDLVLLGLDMTDFHDDMKYQLLVHRAPTFSRLVSRLPMTMTLLSFFDKDILHRLLLLSVKIDGLPLYGIHKSKYFWLALDADESLKSFAYVKDSLDKISDLSHRMGAAFVLFVFPRNFQYNRTESPKDKHRYRYDFASETVLLPFAYFAELSSQVDYPIFSLLETFQQTTVFPTCFEDDPHWNQNGMELAATAIAEQLLAHVMRRDRVRQGHVQAPPPIFPVSTGGRDAAVP
jgi:hypothetical protein